MKTLIIDNYDSFTFNLYQMIGELEGKPMVRRNDEVTIKNIKMRGFTHLVISPGPGSPNDTHYFGICKQLIHQFKDKIPILGVCLGHQGIISVFGGKVVKAPFPVHGKQSLIYHNGQGIFSGINNPIKAMRYHSLIGEMKTLPKELTVTAKTKDEIIMAVEHKQYRVYGIQFHPESIGTRFGKEIIQNFLYKRYK